MTALEAGRPVVDCDPVELWRPTARTPLYEVSSHGRVRRVVPVSQSRPGGIVAPWTSDRGYLYADLSRRLRGQAVHRLVLEAFGPPRPPGTSVDHIDWNRRHNCVRNLRWLAVDLNNVRWWHARDSSGGNVWATRDDPPPCDHTPLTAKQEAELLADLGRAGW